MSELDMVKVSELKKGDIVILEKEEGDFISTAISLLTRSKVTHATISRGLLPNQEHDGVGYIAEETPPHAVYDTLLDRTMRTAYVMRLKDAPDDFTKVMDIVDYYVQEQWPYAAVAQPLLAIYFLVKDITDSLHLRKIGVKLVKLALGVLIELLNKVVYDGKKPMMCSQFAYHCYNLAGEEYTIKLNKEKTNSLLSKIQKEILSNYDKYKDLLEQGYDYMSNEQLQETNVDTYEQIVQELCEALENDMISNESDECLNKFDEDFIVTSYRFLELFYKVFKADEEDRMKKISPQELFNKINEMDELFVSPEDLLHNTENLECVGTVDYEGYHL